MERLAELRKKWVIFTALLGGAATIGLSFMAIFTPMAVEAGGGHN